MAWNESSVGGHRSVGILLPIDVVRFERIVQCRYGDLRCASVHHVHPGGDVSD